MPRPRLDVAGGPPEPWEPTAPLHLDASALLTMWEQGASLDPARRAVSLLATAWPETGWHRWLHASVGRRDGWLLTLREELFGDRLETVAACPSCQAPLEIALRTRDLRAVAPPISPTEPARPGPEPADATGTPLVLVEMDGYRVQGRPPTTADLIAVLAVPHATGRPWHDSSSTEDATTVDPLEATAALLRQCISAARRGDDDVDPAALPTAVREAVTRAMAEADPHADIRLALDCPDCGHRWSSPFDPGSYLWDEIDDWATRLLQQVHALASAYAWSERDILAMSARRRRHYLELCGGWA